MFALKQAVGGAGPGLDDLRSRKKEKTRLAIEMAALTLFAEKGYDATTVDEVADRSDICKATFFRYFAAKGDVLFSVEADRPEVLWDAIVERPAREHDLEAIRHAVSQVWAPLLDPQRVALQTRAAATSALLRGLSFDLGVKWQAGIAGALAHRRGLSEVDRRSNLAAGMALAVFSNAINHWMSRGCSDDLTGTIDDFFATLIEMSAEVRIPNSGATSPRKTTSK
jgi:AcrR family transcriptional regulator